MEEYRKKVKKFPGTAFDEKGFSSFMYNRRVCDLPKECSIHGDISSVDSFFHDIGHHALFYQGSMLSPAEVRSELCELALEQYDIKEQSGLPSSEWIGSMKINSPPDALAVLLCARLLGVHIVVHSPSHQWKTQTTKSKIKAKLSFCVTEEDGIIGFFPVKDMQEFMGRYYRGASGQGSTSTSLQSAGTCKASCIPTTPTAKKSASAKCGQGSTSKSLQSSGMCEASCIATAKKSASAQSGGIAMNKATQTDFGFENTKSSSSTTTTATQTDDFGIPYMTTSEIVQYWLDKADAASSVPSMKIPDWKSVENESSTTNSEASSFQQVQESVSEGSLHLQLSDCSVAEENQPENDPAARLAELADELLLDDADPTHGPSVP